MYIPYYSNRESRVLTNEPDPLPNTTTQVEEYQIYACSISKKKRMYVFRPHRMQIVSHKKKRITKKMNSNSSKNNFPSKLVMLLEDAINEGKRHYFVPSQNGKSFFFSSFSFPLFYKAMNTSYLGYPMARHSTFTSLFNLRLRS